MVRVSEEQKNRMYLGVGRTFYLWFFASLILFIWFVFRSNYSLGTLMVGMALSIFIAASIGLFAALFVSWTYSGTDNKFWSIPFHIADDAHDSLIAEELIARDSQEQKKKRRLKKALGR